MVNFLRFLPFFAAIVFPSLSFALDDIPSSWASTSAEGQAYLQERQKEEGVVALPSGLMYKSLKKGSGDAHPQLNTQCDVHYAGTTIDGKEFDSSYKRGKPTGFAPSQVIKGWTEALQMMVQGDKFELYIPASLAYGDSGAGGRIPPKAALVFQMELITIKGKTTPKKEDL